MIDMSSGIATGLESLSHEEMERTIAEIIKSRVGDAVEGVKVDWLDDDQAAGQIVITVLINTEANPRTWRRSFAGLTTKVKDVLEGQDNRLFPVISARAAV